VTVALASHPKVKLKVEDFDLLAEKGGLAGIARSELLDGDIYLVAPQYSRHADANSLFYDALLDWSRASRPDLVVRTEASVAMPPNDEPMPDVILCTRPTGRKAIPVESVALLVEIADDSRERDLGYKAELFARQGVPEYWVADLEKQVVVRHSRPSQRGYGARDEVSFGKRIEAATLAGLSVETTDLVD
jgi:Uma2 family endonuclease